jgi:hypothetical protein
VHGEAFVPLVATEGGCGAFGAEQRGGRHLAAGHTVNRVIDEHHRDGFAAIGGMHDFGAADGGQVAIALIAQNNALGTAALHCRGYGRGAPVGYLDVAHVEIVVSEYRAAYRADEDGAILYAQFVDGARDQLVHHAVPAAGAVVRLVLQFGLALVGFVERFSLLVSDGVTRH